MSRLNTVEQDEAFSSTVHAVQGVAEKL